MSKGFYIAAIIGFLLFWIILHFPAFTGQLQGTLSTVTIPEEYKVLSKLLASDRMFYRTLWIPQRQRFAFFSNYHPAIDMYSLLNISTQQDSIAWLNNDNSQEQLQRWSVKYIIVPYDSKGELFMKDYTYDDQARSELIASVSAIPWIRTVNEFQDNAVFELSGYKDHVWIEGSGIVSSWEQISPVEYKISINHKGEEDKLIFSERFDQGWELVYKAYSIPSQKTYDGLNSFDLHSIPLGDNQIELYYQPQKYVYIGLVISLTTLCCVILFISVIAVKQYRFKKHQKR